MSCDCLSKYYGRASRDALRVWSGWASTMIHGPRYEPDYGPYYAPGRRAMLRVGPPGRATRRAAGPHHAPDQLQRHRAAGPSDQRTDDANTYQWTSTAGFMYRTLGVLGLRSGVGLGLLESTTHRWTGQLGPRRPPAPARTCSHTWLGTSSRGREEQRGPTRGGTGGRRRLQEAEPGRAGP